MPLKTRTLGHIFVLPNLSPLIPMVEYNRAVKVLSIGTALISLAVFAIIKLM